MGVDGYMHHWNLNFCREPPPNNDLGTILAIDSPAVISCLGYKNHYLKPFFLLCSFFKAFHILFGKNWKFEKLLDFIVLNDKFFRQFSDYIMTG